MGNSSFKPTAEALRFVPFLFVNSIKVFYSFSTTFVLLSVFTIEDDIGMQNMFCKMKCCFLSKYCVSVFHYQEQTVKGVIQAIHGECLSDH